MIDTHCHLTDHRLLDQLDEVLARAATAGVTKMMTIGTDLDDAAAAIAICHNRPQLCCAIGIHPNHAQLGDERAVEHLRELQNDPSVMGLGEMGLDYHWPDVPRNLQQRVFEAQLQIARETRRSVVIHSRESVSDTLAILRNFHDVPAIFHCFTGTTEEATQIIDAGHWMGFTGPVTFKKNDELRAIARLVPADKILVETDSPYLSPEPVRKFKTCEPAFVMHTAAVVAREKGWTMDELSAAVARNWREWAGR